MDGTISFSFEFQIQVAAIIIRKEMTIESASRCFQVAPETILTWIQIIFDAFPHDHCLTFREKQLLDHYEEFREADLDFEMFKRIRELQAITEAEFSRSFELTVREETSWISK